MQAFIPRPAFLGLFYVLLSIGCHEIENSGTAPLEGSGSSAVRKMSAECIRGDYYLDQTLPKSFHVEQAAANWFLLPRSGNVIRASMLWDSESRIEGEMEFIHDKATINSVILDIVNEESFSGYLNADNSFCFHGPIDIKIENAETEAHAYALGEYNKDEASIRFDLYIGVKAVITDPENPQGEKAIHQATVRIPVSGEAAEGL